MKVYEAIYLEGAKELSRRSPGHGARKATETAAHNLWGGSKDTPVVYRTTGRW